MKRKILLVDDEKKILDILALNLQKQGYSVSMAYDGAKGLELALSEDFDLVVLDIMMPVMDGFEVCRKIREHKQTPIIMLTARAEEVDKIVGLELGADDYVTKPFSVRELMARIKTNIRRTEVTEASPDDSKKGTVLNFHDITIDTGRVEVRRNGEVIELTSREFDLIYFLARQSGQVFSREALLEKVWGYEYYGDVRTVDVTIRRLRMKIEKNPENPRYVLTKRGVGYYFDDNGEA